MDTFFGPVRQFDPWHNFKPRLVFGGRVYDVIIVTTQIDIQGMLSEAKKVKMVAWDTECLDGRGKVQSMQFCLGKDKLYFVPMSLDNYVRQTFHNWFPAFMSNNNMKVTFANTENRWLLEVYGWLHGDWLQISRHVDIQEVLYLRTNMVFGLKNAHNLFFPRSEWKEERITKKYSIDVMYSVIDAAATYNVANHILVSSELVSDIDLNQTRERIHEDISKKPLVNEEIKEDNTFDIDQLSQVSSQGNYEADVEDYDSEPAVNIDIPIVRKPNMEVTAYSINFNAIDDSDKEYFKSLGLEMSGSVEQMVNYFEKQTHLVRGVIRDIMMERLKNRPAKPLTMVGRPGDVVDNRNFRTGQVQVNRDPKNVPIGVMSVKKEEVIYNSIQYREFKTMVLRDSSYVNRVRAGGITNLLQELKIQFDLIETYTGLDHERVYKVTLEVFEMKFIGVNKSLGGARNAAKTKFTESLFLVQ